MGTNVESADAEKLEQAIQALSQGETAGAEALLRDIASRVPANYCNEFQRDGARVIRFWNQTEFVHYVTRKREEPLQEKIIWEANVYPRALYHLGFLCVKIGKFEEALQWLEAGAKLDSHPLFWLESGKALAALRQFDAALSKYEHIIGRGDEFPAHLCAVALRGRGFVLIEKGDLEAAEAAFRQSVEIEPESPVAQNELAYIAQLRKGGRRGSPQIVATDNKGQLACFRCGTKDISGGKVASIEGQVVGCCKACYAKLTKKWWQFWK
jgi:tetratricopeptide (TPR) repeat protein